MKRLLSILVGVIVTVGMVGDVSAVGGRTAMDDASDYLIGEIDASEDANYLFLSFTAILRALTTLSAFKSLLNYFPGISIEHNGQ